MYYLKYLVILMVFFFNHLTYAHSLEKAIDTLIKQKLPDASVAVFIRDAQTGSTIYNHNADKLLSPASSMKLFTAAAALYQLKPEFRFQTTLAKKGQNYYLTFTGSPSFTEENLASLLMYFETNKKTLIQGDLIIDSTLYQAPYYPGGTSIDDLGWYYAAPDTAAILNENKVAYELSAKKLGEKVQITARTLPDALHLINELTIVTKEEAKDHCNLNLEIKPQNTIRVFGCIAEDKKPKVIELAIPDPILLIQQLSQKILKDYGIILQGKIMPGQTPSDTKLLASLQSNNLISLITHMLQESDNLYANSLTKKLGYVVTGKGTHKEGAFAIKKILSEHTPLDMSQIELVDGEGTRYNLVTARQLVILLASLYQDKGLQAILLSALPEAGVSGTLKYRMRKTILEKKVYAKTGTMHDISSLSGFIINGPQQTFIFSIIINGVKQPITEVKALEEQIILKVLQKMQERAA